MFLKSIKKIRNFILIKLFQLRNDFRIIISHEILKTNWNFSTVTYAGYWSNIDVTSIVWNFDLTVWCHVCNIPCIKNLSSLFCSLAILKWVNFSNISVSSSFVNQNIGSVSIQRISSKMSNRSVIIILNVRTLRWAMRSDRVIFILNLRNSELSSIRIRTSKVSLMSLLSVRTFKTISFSDKAICSSVFLFEWHHLIVIINVLEWI